MSVEFPYREGIDWAEMTFPPINLHSIWKVKESSMYYVLEICPNMGTSVLKQKFYSIGNAKNYINILNLEFDLEGFERPVYEILKSDSKITLIE